MKFDISESKLKPILDAFQSITYFSPLELYTIAKAIKVKKVDKNTIFVRPDDIADKLYFIVSGKVREYVIYNEKELNTWIHLNGDVTVASRSFMKNQKSELYFETMETSWLATISRSQIQQLENEIPKIVTLKVKMYEDAIVNFENRQKLYTILDAKDRLKAFEELYPKLAKSISDKHIASFLQIHPSTLSLRKD